ncbi:LPXTG cell wall anchor domain-containing protein [Ligilactobacillus agilis]|uniref:LPXTG cell wall anchor domain-containing protein n=1 Tax=Ligilactobacillus agilis TaxID=1601 RepID=UPI001D62ABB8|nr:LPXTG cell wall anchor domain-containing protein [Ligilactobacillus agilis]HJG05281.1 LPXTG cell wall anchor domain-containing protein [Ligilactobacillus agilis]
MKKTKTVLATLSVATALTTFAPLATPVLADGSVANQVTQTQLKDGTQTIGVTYKKTGEETPSETGKWLGNNIRVTVTNHQVSQLVIPNVNAATAGMIKTVTVNNQIGQVQKNADGSVNYVFGAAAYKEGQGTITFNLAVPGVPPVGANMYLATNELPTEPVTPAKPAQPATGAASSSASQATSSSASSSSQTSNAKPAAQPTNNNKVSGTQTGADKTSQEETATIAFYKTGTTEKSVAANFFAPNVNAEVDANGKVTKLVLGISQNASMVKAISLNGVKGTVAVDKDGSGTATFAGSAYKEGKGVINFTIDFGQGPYSPSADVVLGALKAGQAKFTKSNNPAPALSELSGSTQAPTLPTSSKNGASQVPGANQTKQVVLPQTGDNSAKTAGLTLAGLGSVVAAGLAFVLGKKRQAD